MKRYRDQEGTIIKIGDLIQHGMLGQIWIVTKSKEGILIATIVSDDSGKAYSEELAHLGVDIGENGTQIVGNVPRKLLCQP